jgi:hypothetical protein
MSAQDLARLRRRVSTGWKLGGAVMFEGSSESWGVPFVKRIVDSGIGRNWHRRHTHGARVE